MEIINSISNIKSELDFSNNEEYKNYLQENYKLLVNKLSFLKEELENYKIIQVELLKFINSSSEDSNNSNILVNGFFIEETPEILEQTKEKPKAKSKKSTKEVNEEEKEKLKAKSKKSTKEVEVEVEEDVVEVKPKAKSKKTDSTAEEEKPKAKSKKTDTTTEDKVVEVKPKAKNKKTDTTTEEVKPKAKSKKTD